MNLKDIETKETEKFKINLHNAFKKELGLELLVIPDHDIVRRSKKWTDIQINDYYIKTLKIDKYNNVYCKFLKFKPSMVILKTLHRLCNEYFENKLSYHHRSGTSMLFSYCKDFSKYISKKELLKLLTWDYNPRESLFEYLKDSIGVNFFDNTKIEWNEYKLQSFKFTPEEIFPEECKKKLERAKNERF
jgi:hypothetical protein